LQNLILLFYFIFYSYFGNLLFAENKKFNSNNIVSDYINTLKSTNPVIYFKLQCYNQRTIIKRDEYGKIYDKTTFESITKSIKREIKIDEWKDDTQDIDFWGNENFFILNSDEKIEAGDEETKIELEKLKTDLLKEFKDNDKHQRSTFYFLFLFLFNFLFYF
jgi:hypothetical protein